MAIHSGDIRNPTGEQLSAINLPRVSFSRRIPVRPVEKRKTEDSPPRCRGVEVQRCRGAEVQRYRGAEVQRYRGTEVQRCRGTEVQRCRGVEVQRYRGAEVQRYRGTEKTKLRGVCGEAPARFSCWKRKVLNERRVSVLRKSN